VGDDTTRIGGGHVLLGDFISGHSCLQPIMREKQPTTPPFQISRKQQQTVATSSPGTRSKVRSDILFCDFENEGAVEKAHRILPHVRSSRPAKSTAENSACCMMNAALMCHCMVDTRALLCLSMGHKWAYNAHISFDDYFIQELSTKITL
jgi:hypothetical protein